MSSTPTALAHLDGRVMLTDSGIETDIIFGAGRDLPGVRGLPAPGGRRRAGHPRALLPRAPRRRRGARPRVRARDADVAEQPRLGHVARLHAREQLDDLDRAAVAFLSAHPRLEPEGHRSHAAQREPRPPRRRILGRDRDVRRGGAASTTRIRSRSSPMPGAISCRCSRSPTPTRASASPRPPGTPDVPVVLYFTVETDGRLPDGSSLREAIETIDAARTATSPTTASTARTPTTWHRPSPTAVSGPSASGRCGPTPRA